MTKIISYLRNIFLILNFFQNNAVFPFSDLCVRVKYPTTVHRRSPCFKALCTCMYAPCLHPAAVPCPAPALRPLLKPCLQSVTSVALGNRTSKSICSPHLHIRIDFTYTVHSEMIIGRFARFCSINIFY